jgi:hypothetical protein
MGEYRNLAFVCQVVHPNIANSAGNNAGLTSAAKPQYEPITTQSTEVGLRSQRNAKAIIPTRIRVDKQVSQKMVGIHRRGNDVDQNIPARFAVGAPNNRSATFMITNTVITLNRSWITITTIAEAKVKLPKSRKTQAITTGYPGVRSAVGPVVPPNGELSPLPVIKDCARVPNSIPRE